MKVFMYEYSIHQKSPLWGDLEGLLPTAGLIIAVKNRYTHRLIVPDGKMNRSYAAKLVNHSLRCIHQKFPWRLSRKAGGDLGGRYSTSLHPETIHPDLIHEEAEDTHKQNACCADK